MAGAYQLGDGRRNSKPAAKPQDKKAPAPYKPAPAPERKTWGEQQAPVVDPAAQQAAQERQALLLQQLKDAVTRPVGDLGTPGEGSTNPTQQQAPAPAGIFGYGQQADMGTMQLPQRPQREGTPDARTSEATARTQQPSLAGPMAMQVLQNMEVQNRPAALSIEEQLQGQLTKKQSVDEKLADDARAQAEARNKANMQIVDKAKTESRKDARAAKGRFSALESGDFKKLSGQGQGAVNWNNSLREARKLDAAARKSITDADGNGRITVDEAGNVPKGYDEAYNRVFGKPAEGEKMTYSPNVMALLNTTKAQVPGGSVDEFIKGSTGFIDSKELARIEKGTLYDNEGAPEGYVDPRASFVFNTSQTMDKLDNVLKKGRAVLGGVDVRVGLEDSDRDARAQFISQLVNGLNNETGDVKFNLRGEGSQYDRAGGIDVSSIANKKDVAEVQLMDQLRQVIQSNQGSLDPSQDERTALSLSQYGIDPKKWKTYSEYVTTGTTKETNKAADLIGDPNALAGK